MAIDLQQYEVGTIFAYTPATDWCHDGQAAIKEGRDGQRYLADTYWGSGPYERLHPREAATTGEVLFTPSKYRSITEFEAQVYPEDVVLTISRHHGHKRDHYVPVGTPKLTPLDYLRYDLAAAERRLEEAHAAVVSEEQSVARLRLSLEQTEAETA